MSRTRGYAHRIDVRADISEVWQSLLDPARLQQWLAPQSRIDAREGGSYWVRLDTDLAREAHIDVFTPPRRLRLIYMPRTDIPDDDSVIVDDFLLDRDEQAESATGQPATVVRLLGSGVPEAQEWDQMYLRLRGGWERSLMRLKSLLEPSGAKKG